MSPRISASWVTRADACVGVGVHELLGVEELLVVLVELVVGLAVIGEHAVQLGPVPSVGLDARGHADVVDVPELHVVVLPW